MIDNYGKTGWHTVRQANNIVMNINWCKQMQSETDQLQQKCHDKWGER